jgi:hypothetical protein
MASPLLRLLIEPLDLGSDVRAISLDLAEEGAEDPARGPEADAVWAAAIPALAGTDPWALDFPSHLDRLRDFCSSHAIDFRDAASRSVVIPAMEPEDLLALIARFEGETFGIRVGGVLSSEEPVDSPLENALSERGLDAYHHAYTRYSLCGICDFENGSLTLLTDKLSSSEVLRRLRPALTPLGARVDRPE